MFELKRKSGTTPAPSTPEERIAWLLDFMRLQQSINPTPKKAQPDSFELKRSDG